MSKAAALALISVVLLGYSILTMVLMVPFGIAEPGQPEGWAALLLLWPLAELAWTWWVLARRPRQGPEGNVRLARPKALATVAMAALVGGAVGLWLIIFRDYYQGGAVLSVAIAAAGCQIGRYQLRRADADPRSA